MYSLVMKAGDIGSTRSRNSVVKLDINVLQDRQCYQGPAPARKSLSCTAEYQSRDDGRPVVDGCVWLKI